MKIKRNWVVTTVMDGAFLLSLTFIITLLKIALKEFIVKQHKKFNFLIGFSLLFTSINGLAMTETF